MNHLSRGFHLFRTEWNCSSYSLRNCQWLGKEFGGGCSWLAHSDGLFVYNWGTVLCYENTREIFPRKIGYLGKKRKNSFKIRIKFFFLLKFHSHQIFHCFVIAGAFVHYHGISIMALQRLKVQKYYNLIFFRFNISYFLRLANVQLLQ